VKTTGTIRTNEEFEKLFEEALADDMNMPQALSVTWEVAKSSLPLTHKQALLKRFDMVLGVGLQDMEVKIPEKVWELVEEREKYRLSKEYDRADELRKTISDSGIYSNGYQPWAISN
jgi:cysteinyl-tRNA synthetase